MVKESINSTTLTGKCQIHYNLEIFQSNQKCYVSEEQQPLEAFLKIKNLRIKNDLVEEVRSLPMFPQSTANAN